MGHNRGPRLPEHLRRAPSDRDRYHFLHHYPSEDTLLHRQLDPAHGAHLLPLRACVLPAGRGGREGHTRHQYPPVTRCVPVASIKDPPSDVPSTSAYRKILTVHLHHEHSQYISHSDYNKLEFQRS